MNSDSCLVTSQGKRITERAIQRGLRVSVIAGAMGLAGWALTCSMPLTMFLEALGASGLLMGLVMTMYHVSMVLQIPAALLAERLVSRKACWGAVMIASRVLWIGPVILLALLPHRPLSVARGTVVVMGFSSMMSLGVSVLWFSWMADLVPDRIRGRFWGLRHSFTMAAFLVGTALAGYILDVFPSPVHEGGSWTGFSIVFVLGAVLGCIDIVIHLLVPEPKPERVAASLHWLARVAAPLRDRDFRRLTIAMGVYTFSVGLMSLGIVYLKRDYQVTYSHLSAIVISASVGAILFGFVWGYVIDRVGGRALAAIALMLTPLSLLGWFFLQDYRTDIVGLFHGVWGIGPGLQALVEALPRSWSAWITAQIYPQAVWIMGMTNFLAGAMYGGMTVSQLNLSGALAPREGRTMAMAVYWSAGGLIGALGSVVGGRAMDYLTANPIDYTFPTGTPLSFQHLLAIVHMLILWCVVLPMILSLRRRQGELPVKTAFSRLLIANPLRAVTSIYVMGSAVTSRKRASAVRKLGVRRTSIAVSDVIEKLDDASADVREEAAVALGRIGSPEAIDALVRKLDDPHSDLGPQIARALRQTKSPKSVSALVRRLDDPDRETKSESARALGEIGDRRAVPSLLDLLSRTDDTKVVSASSEALARLGELAAIYEILPRMKRTRNPVLKHSLAVALGDLLGERDGFYKVLTKEQQARGSEVNRLLKDLRRAIRNATKKSMEREGQTLVEKCRTVQSSYDDELFIDCSRLLFDLAIGLAALRWGVEFGGDAKALVDEIIWRDQHFGVGVWYLSLYRRASPRPPFGGTDDIDILLGVYFLACHWVKPTSGSDSRAAT